MDLHKRRKDITSGFIFVMNDGYRSSGLSGYLFNEFHLMEVSELRDWTEALIEDESYTDYEILNEIEKLQEKKFRMMRKISY